MAVFDFEFTRAVAGGAARIYTASGIVGQRRQGFYGTEEGESYYTFEAGQPVVVTDPVTSEQLDLGRNFCTSNCNLESILPAESKNYSPQPDPDLPGYVAPLFTNDVAAVPNTDVPDLPNHPILGGFDGPNVTPISYDSQGPVEVQDRRLAAKTTVVARTGDADPDFTGTYRRFQSPVVLDNSGSVRFNAVVHPFPDGDNSEGFYRVDGTTSEKLVRTGDPAPGDGQTFIFGEATFNANRNGQIAFQASVTGPFRSGIYRKDASGIVEIARQGMAAPDGNGSINKWQGYTAPNDSGQIALTGIVTVDESTNPRTEIAVYRADGNNTVKIVRQGEIVPGLNNPATIVYANSIDQSGKVAVNAFTANGESGIYLGDGNTLTPIAYSGSLAPGGGRFVRPDEFGVRVNDVGQVFFTAQVESLTNSADTWIGAFIGDGATTTEVIRLGVRAPDDDGNVRGIFDPKFNNSGQVAFQAEVANGFNAPYPAMMIAQQGELQQIARFGQPSPDGNGTFIQFGRPEDLSTHFALNNSGHVAFQAALSGTVGGASDDDGIFLFDGTNLIQVAREGQTLAGSSIVAFDLTSLPGSLNDNMQVAYAARLADGREVIARFDPDNYWRGAAAGSWEADSEWSLRVDPTAPYNAFIVAENPLVVTGPIADAGVRSVTLGGENSAQAELKLQAGVRLAALDGVTVRPNGLLSGLGTIDGDVANLGGLVSPGSSPGVLQVDGNFVQDSVGILLLEIAGPQAGTQYDVLDVTGSIQLAGDVVLAFLNGYTPGPGTRLELLRFGGDLDLSLANFYLADAPAGLQATPFVENGVFGLAVTAVPEPATSCYVAVVGLLWAVRRTRDVAHPANSLQLGKQLA